MSETRGEILEAAQRIVVEEGYEALTTQRVADAVDLTSAGVHYHFETKDDLVAELIGYLETELGSELDSHEGPPDERLAAIVSGQFATAEAVRELTAPPGLQLTLAASRDGDEIREAMVSYLKTYVDHVADLIREGVDEGVFETEDPERVAAFLASMTDCAAVRSALDLPLDPLAESVTEHVLDDLYVGDPPEVTSA